MRRTATAVATVALTAGIAVPGALASTVGDTEEMPYPGETTPPGQTLPETQQPPTDEAPPQARPGGEEGPAATLPFTGGELVVLVAAGAGAIGAGTALVAATRRRRPESA